MHVLLVDDDEDVRRLFEKLLAARGHDVTACSDAESAWAAYQRRTHPLVLLDWQLPGMDGLELCRRIRAMPEGAHSVIVMITARDQPDDVHAVLQAGANDYVAKPVPPALLKVRLTIAEELVRDRARRRLAEAGRPSETGPAGPRAVRFAGEASFEDLVGASPAINLVYQKIRDVAKADVTVLIEGETGTGTELVARAIHACSRRADHPFIAVNCAGLTESLLGSQLFGHRKGAFTGASESHQGFFEAASGGTIFLDEIGDIPGPVQTALLRVLQEKEVTRIGETSPRKVDVRVLAATHHNLSQDVVAGRFRADLLYRLRVARIQLPPLRERREDIPLLVASFLVPCRGATGQLVRDVSNQAMHLLTEYPWPGNVRELKSAIESAAVCCRGTVVETADLPTEIAHAAGPASLSGAYPGDERERIVAALAEANGNRTAAARLLGVSRATFYRRLADFDILSNL